MLIFDDTEKQKAIDTTSEQWENFKNALVIKAISYDDTDKAKEENFLKVFDDLFRNSHSLVELDIADIYVKYPLYRAVRLSDNEVPDYTRFIPDATKGGCNNRFSPKGIEWLYLGISNGRSSNEEIKTCCIKEIKPNNGDRVAICKFEVNRKFHKNQKRNYVIDLTIADNTTYDELNRDLEKMGLSQSLRTYKIKKWVAFTYMKMLSSEIFVPLSSVDTSIEYLPFQCLAKYFERHNLRGIIYKSTVYEKFRNIVLFDKKIASPVGDIEVRKI
ncbi:MAG: RES domain-containing protein [Synergistaceae bacterium]|nr:RES domain-containing protein [Synergistaceae bacterium]